MSHKVLVKDNWAPAYANVTKKIKA